MYDLLIKNGLVVDGSGDVPFLAGGRGRCRRQY